MKTMFAAVELQDTPLDLIAEKQRQIEALGWREYDRGDPWVVKYRRTSRRVRIMALIPGFAESWATSGSRRTTNIASRREKQQASSANGSEDRSDGEKERRSDAFLEAGASRRQASRSETHTDTHAIVVERDQGKAFLIDLEHPAPPRRYVSRLVE